MTVRYQIDHDLHIHTHISLCSRDPEQTPERILQYGTEKGLRHLCITDHFWDETVPSVYDGLSYARLAENLPLPKADGVAFHFGCEADMDLVPTIGIRRETAEKFDFIIVPTTHMHFVGVTIRKEEATDKKARARRYVERWEALLRADLPFYKMGIAHLTWCGLAGAGAAPWPDHIDILDSIPDDTFLRLFSQTEKNGMGVELNVDLQRYQPDELERILRVYRLAVECGCHFYFGSDAHHPQDLNRGYDRFGTLVDLLQLEEEQKFQPFRE